MKLSPSTIFGGAFVLMQSLPTFYEKHQPLFALLSAICGLIWAYVTKDKAPKAEE